MTAYILLTLNCNMDNITDKRMILKYNVDIRQPHTMIPGLFLKQLERKKL